jgi:hypothetical protein
MEFIFGLLDSIFTLIINGFFLFIALIIIDSIVYNVRRPTR